MSDLQDVIVSSSIKAFNSGYRSGVQTGRSEIREKVLAYIKELRQDKELGMAADYLFCDDLIDYIENDRNPL